MNAVHLTGRLTRDLEIRRTSGGKAVASYSLAVKRPRAKDTTDFLSVVTWEQGAEYLAKYAHKGDLIAVSGALTARSWTNKDGQKQTSYEVVTDNVEIVSAKKDTEATGYTPKGVSGAEGFQEVDIPDEALPF